MYVHSSGSAEQIPGGIPYGTLEQIKKDIEGLHALRAGFEQYGMAMTTESDSVTERDSGLVLWAGEKNSALEGTLANRIQNISEIYRYGKDDFVESTSEINLVTLRAVRVGRIMSVFADFTYTGDTESKAIIKMKPGMQPPFSYCIYSLFSGIPPYREAASAWVSEYREIVCYGIEKNKRYFFSGSWICAG